MPIQHHIFHTKDETPIHFYRNPAVAFLYELKQIRRIRDSGDIVFELYIPDFRLSYGEFVAIVGPSGCGKSTLLDLLALVARPHEDPPGIFNFAGLPISQKVNDIIHLWQNRGEEKVAQLRRRYIGYVLQTGGLLPYLSVRQNIELACRLKGLDRVGSRINEIVVILGIENQLNKKPQYLSGGERQRAAIARAMVHEPTVVLADEPTAAVDSDRAKRILEEFKQLAAKKKTAIVMATHNHNLVENVATQVATFKVRHFSENGVKKTLSTLISI
jgi:putative ABC transport system ATP-binding protein